MFEGEAQFAMGSHLQAAREFRKVSDDTPNDPLAPEALLRVGDVYADLWRRPELDPSYGQTALATYQELLNRYPGTTAAKRAQERIDDLQERFATRNTRRRCTTCGSRPSTRPSCTSRTWSRRTRGARWRPDALIHLVQAYRTLGYKEDVQETCGYIRRFHAKAPGAVKACPDSVEPGAVLTRSAPSASSAARSIPSITAI